MMKLFSDCEGCYTIWILHKKDGKLYRNSSPTLDKGIDKLKKMAGWTQNRRSTLILETPEGVEAARSTAGKLEVAQ
jgi:hypothetical protein